MRNGSLIETHRAAVAASLVLAVLILAGCGGGSYRVSSLHLPPDHTATVRVIGDRPFVSVTNAGPGNVELTYPGSAAEPLIRGSIGRTVRGGGSIMVQTAGEPARIDISVQRARGFELLGPAPRE